MRLRERDKREVTVYLPADGGDDAYAWGAAVSLRAAIYPAGAKLTAQLCGDRLSEMALMLYDGDFRLETGMGVSEDGGTPQWRIVTLEGWKHQRALLERIPEGRRGGEA